jgi:hypothetical protein
MAGPWSMVPHPKTQALPPDCARRRSRRGGRKAPAAAPSPVTRPCVCEAASERRVPRRLAGCFVVQRKARARPATLEPGAGAGRARPPEAFRARAHSNDAVRELKSTPSRREEKWKAMASGWARRAAATMSAVSEARSTPTAGAAGRGRWRQGQSAESRCVLYVYTFIFSRSKGSRSHPMPHSLIAHLCWRRLTTHPRSASTASRTRCPAAAAPRAAPRRRPAARAGRGCLEARRVRSKGGGFRLNRACASIGRQAHLDGWQPPLPRRAGLPHAHTVGTPVPC